MSEPIITREEIARQADEAARRFAQAPRGAEPPANPHPAGSDAAAAWDASFQRQLLWHSAPDAEASA